jgi:hypothetical protein
MCTDSPLFNVCVSFLSNFIILGAKAKFLPENICQINDLNSSASFPGIHLHLGQFSAITSEIA